jgi:coenzyme F420-reducing hydrogenase alpha subunit
MAHAVAVRRAIEAASGKPAPAALEAARVIALEAEACAAAAFRFGALWPAALGLRPDPRAGVARRAAEALTVAAFQGRADTLSGPALSDALTGLMRDGPVLAAMEAASALRALADPERPGKDLFGRFSLMLQDAAARAYTCARIKTDGAAAPLDPLAPWAGRGAGSSPALRGAVVVRLRIAEGLIAEATISAPSDRVLAYDAALARTLSALTDPSLAPLVCLAFDPCAPVVCQLSDVREAAHA